jgi:hypothetical protein
VTGGGGGAIQDRGRGLLHLLGAAALVVAIATGCDGDGTTGVGVDREPPAVVGIEPPDGMVAVAPETPVRVIFSEPVVIDSLVPPVRVVSDGVPVDALVALDSTATRVTLTPAVPWPVGEDFRIVVAAGIADQSGNARPDSMVSRFSTGLAFEEVGRVFVANDQGRSLTVLELGTYAEVEGSPVELGVAPRRLCADRDTGLLHVLYSNYVDGYGVLALDARTLEVVRDSGPVLPFGLADLAVASRHGRVYVVDPAAAAVIVLDAATLTEARTPYRFERPDAEPVRLAVAERLDYLVVGLEGGGQLAVLDLPALTMVPGFPAPATDDLSDLAVDEERSYVWVTGSERFAVVDLLSAGRTESFQMPVATCWWCTPRLWGVTIAPHLGEAILMYRRQALATIDLETREVTSATPSDLGLGNLYLGDMVLDPRSGNLILLGWGNLETPLYLASAETLGAIPVEMPVAGNGAVDMELVP